MKSPQKNLWVCFTESHGPTGALCGQQHLNHLASRGCRLGASLLSINKAELFALAFSEGWIQISSNVCHFHSNELELCIFEGPTFLTKPERNWFKRCGSSEEDSQAEGAGLPQLDTAVCSQQDGSGFLRAQPRQGKEMPPCPLHSSEAGFSAISSKTWGSCLHGWASTY